MVRQLLHYYYNTRVLNSDVSTLCGHNKQLQIKGWGSTPEGVEGFFDYFGLECEAIHVDLNVWVRLSPNVRCRKTTRLNY